MSVGESVGRRDGYNVGDKVGNNVGIFVGCNVGNMVGYFSGEAVGEYVVGKYVGIQVHTFIFSVASHASPSQVAGASI